MSQSVATTSPLDYGVFAGVAAMAVMLGTLSSFGMQIVLLADVSREPKCRDDILPFALTTTMICGSVLFASYLLLATMLMGNVVRGMPVKLCSKICRIRLAMGLLPSKSDHRAHAHEACLAEERPAADIVFPASCS